jgi:predicted PurR-regulated permease PerM
MNSTKDQLYPRVFGLAVAVLLGFALFRILQPFLGSILWAFLLAFLLFPVNQALRRALRGRRGLAALLLTLGVILLVVIPAALLTVVFAQQAADLIGRLQAAASQYHIAQASDLLRIPILDRTLRGVGRLLPVTAEQVQAGLVDAGKRLLEVLVGLSGSAFAGALGAVVSFVLTLFLLFFFLRDGEEMVERSLRLIPMTGERKAHLVAHLAAVTQAVVVGTLLTAVVQGSLVGISFAIVRLPSPVVFGALSAAASLLPLVGTALVWVPAAGVLAVQGRWGAAIFMLVWGAGVVSMAENFVRPLFVSGRAQISTLPVFIGLLGGISAFGPIGLVLGPVLIALVLALLRFAEEEREGAGSA